MQQDRNFARGFWWPVSAAALLLAITLGTRSSLGLFVGPINSATALGAAAIGLALALSQLAWGAAQPLWGLAAQRLGTARVVALGGVLAAAGLALVTVASTQGALIGALLVAGAAGAAAGGAPLLMGAVAQRVAAERRGFALGFISAGGSAGQLVLAFVGAALIGGAGWQVAMLAFGALALAAVPLGRAFAAQSPAADRPALSAPAHVSARAALRAPSYWCVTFGFFVCGFHVSFLTTHMPSVIELCGLPTAFSGLWLAIVGACNIAGSLGAGWLMQRVAMKWMLAALYALRAAGVALFLWLPTNPSLLLGFALWMGFTFMATLPATTGLIAKLYGARQVALLFGITMMLHQVGSFFGVWFGGLELELTGGYRWTWVIDMALAAVAALVHLPVREEEAPAPVAARLPQAT